MGDIHGFITKLQILWSNLEASLDRSEFEIATLIFLGDYCDRGPDTRHLIEFLVSLPSRYLLGGVVQRGRVREYAASREKVEWEDKGEGTEYQGSIYDAGPTFESYGVLHASAGNPNLFLTLQYDGSSLNADLVKAVPDDHKKFLADLVWVHEEDDVFVNTDDGVKCCKLIAVHAGLEKGKDLKEQLKLLKARDTRVPKVEALSGRKSVWDIPEEIISENEDALGLSVVQSLSFYSERSDFPREAQYHPNGITIPGTITVLANASLDLT
ncbi:hypothetical protein JHK82_027133 [Glycine max]|nr:hypothetical protein JHK82_027133 [Glycine max]